MVVAEVRKHHILVKVNGDAQEIGMELAMILASVYQSLKQRDEASAKLLKKILQSLTEENSPLWKADIPNMASVDVPTKKE